MSARAGAAPKEQPQERPPLLRGPLDSCRFTCAARGDVSKKVSGTGRGRPAAAGLRRSRGYKEAQVAAACAKVLRRRIAHSMEYFTISHSRADSMVHGAWAVKGAIGKE